MRATDLPLNYNAVNILEHNLAERADKVALLSASRELTFRQVSNEVNQVGNALKRLDVRMGETVAILSPDLPEWVTSFFGILKIGAIAAGMNTLLKPHEHAYILRDARARVLIVHASLLPGIESIRNELEFVKHIIVIGDPSTAPLSSTPLRSAQNGSAQDAATVPPTPRPIRPRATRRR